MILALILCAHNRQLPDRLPYLADCNFIIRMHAVLSVILTLIYFVFSFTVNDANCVLMSVYQVTSGCFNCGLSVTN